MFFDGCDSTFVVYCLQKRPSDKNLQKRGKMPYSFSENQKKSTESVAVDLTSKIWAFSESDPKQHITIRT